MARLDCEIHRIACAGGADLALRIYPTGRLERAPIQAEIAWLAALAGEGLMTPRPLADRDGHVLQAWPGGPGRPTRQVLLLTWVRGRVLDKGLRPVHLGRVGELTACMHRAAERLVREGRIRARWPADAPDLAGWASGARPRSARLAASARVRLRETAQRLLHDIAALPQDAGSRGFVHGDLHLWNLLFAGQRAGAIDFSDSGIGHHAQDLAATLQYLRHPFVHNHDQRRHYAAMRDALLAGYARHRALPAQVQQQVDVFIVARMLNTVEWVLDGWQRVDQRPWGPGFLRRANKVFDNYLR